MSTSNADNLSNLADRPSRYSIYKRIANLALVIVAGIICVNLWLLSTDHAANWHSKQSSQLGRSLASYAAQIIAPSLANKDYQQIAQNLHNVAQDPHVISASLYSYQGQIVDSTQSNPSVLATFLIEENTPIVFVQEVIYQDNIVGYLRILLDERQVMLYHEDYQLQLYEQLLVLMLLSGLVGLLVARAYYKFRFRHYSPNS